jgi:N-acetylneuraminic acid mutarotase
VLSALLLVVALAMIKSVAHRSHAANHTRQQLTFEDRVAAQRAIEEVYWRRRIWPKNNPQPKPPLDHVMPDAAIRAKVEDHLRKSAALDIYWQRPITPDELQAEIGRMARQSKQPDALGELWAALGNDPLLVAECLARPLLADRLLRERYAADERFHGESRRRAEAELNWPDAAHRLREMSGEYREVEWRLVEDAAQREVTARDGVVALQPAEWRAQMERLQRMFDPAPDGVPQYRFRRKGLVNEPLPPEGGTTNAVSPRLLPLGQVSALQEDEERRYAAAVLEQSARRVKVAMVEWRKAAFDEWWGRVKAEMAMDVAAASGEYRLPEIEAQPGSCFTDAWRFTSQTGAPSARANHTAVWTGSEMIVWGGLTGSGEVNTGGRYNPATNSWSAANTADAPIARSRHTAVWTGSEMIVWGGENINSIFGTGGRYNPASDTWGTTNTTGAPTPRRMHTAVWTGSEMIVWGGFVATGGRYNPTTNTWITTSTTGAPTARVFAIGSQGAVWTGREMIIWGGSVDLDPMSGRPNDGGRYNPATDMWTATNTVGAPTARDLHTAVWTGSEMIIWGGRVNSFDYLATGGRYNPTTNTWTATSTTGTPGERVAHTAVWTGSEMIIWGGSPIFDPPRGGRYNPMTDTWLATSLDSHGKSLLNIFRQKTFWNPCVYWLSGLNGVNLIVEI